MVYVGQAPVIILGLIGSRVIEVGLLGIPEMSSNVIGEVTRLDVDNLAHPPEDLSRRLIRGQVLVDLVA